MNRAARPGIPRPHQLGFDEVPTGSDDVEHQPTNPTAPRGPTPNGPFVRMAATPTDVFVDDQPNPLGEAR